VITQERIHKAASFRQRLLNLAKAEGRVFNHLLQFYAMERFLFRLSQSPHSRFFVLKGGLMFRIWHGASARPTMDIDLLARADNEPEVITLIFRDICGTSCEEDGMHFDAESLAAIRIKEDARYSGVRLNFLGYLGTARVPMQIDLGFDDIIHPQAEDISLPVLLPLPAPILAGYSKESVIAEKYEAMTKLGLLNTRMKDFYDLWHLSRNFAYTGDRLAGAIAKTFGHRGTLLSSTPSALSPEFSKDKQVLWRSFRARIADQQSPAELQQVTDDLQGFLITITAALLETTPVPAHWPAGGPWVAPEEIRESSPDM